MSEDLEKKKRALVPSCIFFQLYLLTCVCMSVCMRMCVCWVCVCVCVCVCVPYVLVTYSQGAFRWDWFVLYALLPVAVAALLWQAKQADRAQRGNWRDLLVLAALGLAVDLRWFESAWRHSGAN